MKSRKRVRQGCCLSQILFKLHSERLINEALEWFGDFKLGQVIRTVKCANEHVLLAKEKAVLQGVIDK
jgi:hypothetical protein